MNASLEPATVANYIIPKSTIFGSVNWFKELHQEQKLFVVMIDSFATKAKRERPANDVQMFAQKWLYDWLFAQINNNRHYWESNMFIPLQFQVDEKSEGDREDCLTLWYRYGDEEHAFFKIYLI